MASTIPHSHLCLHYSQVLCASFLCAEVKNKKLHTPSVPWIHISLFTLYEEKITSLEILKICPSTTLPKMKMVQTVVKSRHNMCQYRDFCAELFHLLDVGEWVLFVRCVILSVVFSSTGIWHVLIQDWQRWESCYSLHRTSVVSIPALYQALITSLILYSSFSSFIFQFWLLLFTCVAVSWISKHPNGFHHFLPFFFYVHCLVWFWTVWRFLHVHLLLVCLTRAVENL